MLTKEEWLRKIYYEAGGVTNTYPFIELGYEHYLRDFVQEGLVALVPSKKKNPFDEVHLTDKGRIAICGKLNAVHPGPKYLTWKEICDSE